eukprot:5148767-Prymnesium_polylepis.1
MDHCEHACIELNGDLQYECGDCAPAAQCHPGAIGFSEWQERAGVVGAQSSRCPEQLVTDRDAYEAAFCAPLEDTERYPQGGGGVVILRGAVGN